MSYQNIIIVGNVGRDAELKYTSDGIAILKFSVAVNKQFRKGEEKVQTTTWFSVTVWRERGEALSNYIKSGMQVLVTGEIHASPYLDERTNKPAASLEINASDIKLLSSKRATSGTEIEDEEHEEEPQF